jgi:hypothetical protein
MSGRLAPGARDNPVVSIAMRYLGVPYQWGGATPKTGFDCSGLVKYVFGQLGLSLPHYAASQWYSPGAVWVAPNRLQPGDLVFFTGSDGTRKEPGHVGIYVDDGYIIDAPHTGSFVRIDSLGEPKLADEYVGAKRILDVSLDARHQLHVTRPGGSASLIPPGFPAAITLEPMGEPLGVAAAGTAAVQTATGGYWIWTGETLSSLFSLPRGYWSWASITLAGLLILLFTAGLVARRRHAPDANPSADSPN